MAVRIADKLQQFNDQTYFLVDSSAVEYIDKNGVSHSVKDILDEEEIEAMADLILDTEVRIDKTYSSSKIYTDIQQCLEDSKTYTLEEIAKLSGASYKVVASTSEMTSESIIYLLASGNTYDMYIVEKDGTATKIGDTTINLDDYFTKAEIEADYLKKVYATETYATITTIDNHIGNTVAHMTQDEKDKLVTTDNITSTINNSSDNTQVPTAKATYNLANTKADASHTHIISDIKGLSIPSKVSELTNDAGYISEVINNLTSTDTDKPLSANQGKILNDTKLNKTDANKLNCVTIDNVSLKEYILTNFTGTGKTYYLIAKTTCTDLPKASNFYITVETPGLYTYKVTAKELNDSNGIYVCTYRTISSSWTAWEKVCTTTVADVDKVTITTQNLIEGIVSYFVKNGICYVSISGITPSLNGGSTIITANTLPLPNTKGNNHYTIGTTSGTVGLLVINNDGSATFYGQSTLSYFGIFSYPVAE